MLDNFYSNFHFIRPEWFYALIPALILFIWLYRRKEKTIAWSSICDQELLDHFLIERGKKASRYPIILVFIAWILATIALAGPSWTKIKLPVFSDQNALIIIFDLSLSMNAQDLKPSRLTRAKHKLTDLLKQREEGQTALIVYAGDAHIVSPLTTDNKTILSFVSVLDTNLMPIPGSNVSSALLTAERLFTNAGLERGEIILFTDGLSIIEESDIQKDRNNNPGSSGELTAIVNRFKDKKISLSILGVGTNSGAPIPLSQDGGGFVKNAKGNIVVSQLKTESLNYLAKLTGGHYQTMQLGDEDLRQIKQSSSRFNKQLEKALKDKHDDSLKDEQPNSDPIKSEEWLDYGAWFSILLIPVMLFAFRRGWLLSISLIMLLPYPEQAYSLEWNDLWLRADQQASQSFQQGQHQEAAEQFVNPSWKGSAYYKAKDYQQAVSHFKDSKNINDQYNLANSYAHLKQFDDAIKTYDEVLKQNPEHQLAQKNKKIIEDLLKQQQQQQKQQDQKQQGDNAENQDSQNDKQDQQKSQSDSQDNQQSEDQQGEESEQSGEQNQEQEQSQQQDSAKENSEEKEQEQSTEEKKKALEELQKKKEQEEKEQQGQSQAEQKAGQDEQENQDDEQKNNGEKKPDDTLFSQLSEEEQQSMQQYLNQIKDDPAYLLRRKFYLNSTRSKQSAAKQAAIQSMQQNGTISPSNTPNTTPYTTPKVQQSW